MEEKQPVPDGVEELADDQLKGIVGGQTLAREDYKYYKYVGTNSDEDWNASYLCPNCGRPVHYGGYGFFFCDPCDEKWWEELSLKLNLQSGMWKQITRKEYKKILMSYEI